MIVNNQLKFVFVHIPKTGGTSVSAALRSLPGKGKKARHPDTKHETWSDFVTAYESRTGRDPSRLKTFKVVAACRNPWARFLSLHRYLLIKHKENYPDVPHDVNEFARAVADGAAWSARLKSLRPQSAFVAGVGPALTMWRFETLQAEFDQFCRSIGADVTLPHRNSSGSRSESYLQLFDTRTADFIAERYADDIEQFGYGYDDPVT